MTHDLESLTARLLDAARRAGADAADAMALRGASVSIDVRHGRLEQAGYSFAGITTTVLTKDNKEVVITLSNKFTI